MSDRRVWVLQRDYRFYRAYPTWAKAYEEMRLFAPGSKHKWRIRKARLKMEQTT